MALKTTSIRGTRDVVPSESHKWQYVERVTREVAESHGFKEIRIPTIEKTELFVKSVGGTTDIVQKEMYTFDKGAESITLRPEATSGIVRSVLENGMLNDGLPLKVFTHVSCFRHENPQAGRLREFHQFDVEAFGSGGPIVDAEIISVGNDVIKGVGIKNVKLEINSIGCPKCRPDYNKKLVEYYKAHYDDICETCKDRLERNPLRLLDCKEDMCSGIAANAPLIVDNLCDECGEHFDGLKRYLDAMGLKYEINPKIVRGIDYYTRTVFEFISGDIGSQATVCGGGRYDGLIEELGCDPTPASGFGMGLERLIMVMEALGCEFPPAKAPDIYIGSIGDGASLKSLALVTKLRDEGIFAVCDTVGRSVKAQMKYADKVAAKLSCIIGDDELQKGEIAIRNMQSGESKNCKLDDKSFIDFLYADIAEQISEGSI